MPATSRILAATGVLLVVVGLLVGPLSVELPDGFVGGFFAVDASRWDLLAANNGATWAGGGIGLLLASFLRGGLRWPAVAAVVALVVGVAVGPDVQLPGTGSRFAALSPADGGLWVGLGIGIAVGTAFLHDVARRGASR